MYEVERIAGWMMCQFPEYIFPFMFEVICEV